LRGSGVGCPLTKPRVNLVLIIIRINLAKVMLLVLDYCKLLVNPIHRHAMDKSRNPQEEEVGQCRLRKLFLEPNPIQALY